MGYTQRIPIDLTQGANFSEEFDLSQYDTSKGVSLHLVPDGQSITSGTVKLEANNSASVEDWHVISQSEKALPVSGEGVTWEKRYWAFRRARLTFENVVASGQYILEIWKG